jgi:hypothetical protein
MAMNKVGTSFIAILALLCAFNAFAREAMPADAVIVQRIIKNSIAGYPGNCPCPYNTARNGSRCGKRSAYNRAGGYAPLCFKEDVSRDMVQEYRQRNKG